KSLQSGLVKVREEAEMYKREIDLLRAEKDKHIDMLNNSIAILSSELEETKLRIASEQNDMQMQQQQSPSHPMMVASGPPVVYTNEVRDGEVKVLRARLEAERK